MSKTMVLDCELCDLKSIHPKPGRFTQERPAIRCPGCKARYEDTNALPVGHYVGVVIAATLGYLVGRGFI